MQHLRYSFSRSFLPDLIFLSPIQKCECYILLRLEKNGYKALFRAFKSKTLYFFAVEKYFREQGKIFQRIQPLLHTFIILHLKILYKVENIEKCRIMLFNLSLPQSECGLCTNFANQGLLGTTDTEMEKKVQIQGNLIYILDLLPENCIAEA